MRSENTIKEQLILLKQSKIKGGPYSELKTIAWNATIQALEWVLGEKEKLLTY